MDMTKMRQSLLRHVGVANSAEELADMKTLANGILSDMRKARLEPPGQTKLFNFDVDTDDGLTSSVNTKNNPFERDLEANEGPPLGCVENEARIIDGPFEVVEWIFSNMGLNGIFRNVKSDGAKIKLLKQCVAGMLVAPASKRGLSEWLAEFTTNYPSLDKIYRFMDELAKQQEKVCEIVRSNSETLCGQQVKLALYDVTTLYFESFKDDGYRQCGYSKDNKFKETQIVLALATTPDGLPLWYKTYPGKTWEGKTLCDFINDWKAKAANRVKDGVVAADCGMFNQDNLAELKAGGLHYVLGSPLKKLCAGDKEKLLNLENYTQFKTLPGDDKYAEKSEGEKSDTLKYYILQTKDGGHIVVTWSAARAAKNAHDRDVLIERTLKKLQEKASKKEKKEQKESKEEIKDTEKVIENTKEEIKDTAKETGNKESDSEKSEQKTQGTVRGEKIIGNRGTLRFLKLQEGQEANEYVLDEAKISEDARWDGFRGVVTDLAVSNEREICEVLSHYNSLWRIEESFRINKSDLKIRPIYHWKKERIEAHILLCYLVFACLRYLQHRVFLQQKEKMSAKRLMKAMLDIDSGIFRDRTTGKVYRLPKRLGEPSKKLYKALGIKHSTSAKELLNTSVYYERTKLQPPNN